MNHKDLEFLTIDKVGVLDFQDDELCLICELKEDTKVYKVEDLLKRMIGTTVQFKSVSDED